MLNILAIVQDVDTEQRIRRTLQDFLIRPHAFSGVPDLATGFERLRTDPPQVVLIHHDPHTCHAVIFLERMHFYEMDLPVLVIAPRAEGLLAADAMQQGAAGFVALEELNTAVLAQAVDQAHRKCHARQQAQAEEQRLREQHEEMQSTIKAKDEFIATVSHELRTPLLNVKEGLSLLLEGAHGPMSPPQEEFLRLVLENVTQLSKFLNDLLDLSKLEAGRAKLDRRQISVVTLAKEVAQSCRTLVSQHTLVNEITEPLPAVYVDASRIKQVFTNLVGNAVKYTPAGGTITMRAAATEAFVEVTVADTGMGISQENLGKLFEKYQQVSGAASVHKGTGLGLALCKELVELHHGAIRAESEEGQGTRFIFTLPRFTALTAFAESLTSMAAQAEQERRGVCLAALDISAWRAAYPAPPMTWDAVGQRLEKIVQQQIHHGEQALRMHDTTCVIIAILDAPGLRTLCGRIEPLLAADLQAVLPARPVSDEAGEGAAAPLPLGFKCAVYPVDGATPEELLANAQPLRPALNKRLLLADATPEALTGARTRLELSGYDVEMAGTGTEALARLQQGGVDAAVLDVQLPQMDGFTLCQQLKGDAATANIPVLLSAAPAAVTATIDDRCIGVGAFGWLRKPWTTDELMMMLQRALEESNPPFKW